MSSPGKKLIDALYLDRERYTIVGLTGYADSGCTRLANLMSSEFRDWEGVRKPEDIQILEPNHSLYNDDLVYAGANNHQCISMNMFARKYTICYNFAKEKYLPFKIIKYSKVLFLYTLRYLIEHPEDDKDAKESFKERIQGIVSEKFGPQSKKKAAYYEKIPENSLYINIDGLGIDWNALFDELSRIYMNEDEKEENKKYGKEADPKLMAEVFFNPESQFGKFCCQLSKLMWKTDAYCTSMFFHRLGFVVRATANPMTFANEVAESNEIYGEHLYVIVRLINSLIKGYRKMREGDEGCTRIVIDKIRNSLEAKYLKERYSAFYLVAVHDDEASVEHLISRLKDKYEKQGEIEEDKEAIELQAHNISDLDAVERAGNDFEKGKFFAPNLSQCVADAEIHISNTQSHGAPTPIFYTMSEQWMKYAVLIQHPGLITPSSEERCMVVAYTAKFNSGCLSRQVGAVITNKSHTIRTIGWNDVPYGQLPCSLREINVMAFDNNNVNKTREYIYSEYETNESRLYRGQTFIGAVRKKYGNLHIAGKESEMMKGFPHPYCFKKLQNDFENVKNQVHTRSLHAEENAILQMAKYGGEALHGGIIYVTASPCELCCKKLYQIGVRKIVYIDEYPGISRENIINNGYHRPRLKQFQGAYGSTYFKLYQPMIPYKEELYLRNLTGTDLLKVKEFTSEEILKGLSDVMGINLCQKIQDEEDYKTLMELVHSMFKNNEEEKTQDKKEEKK